MINKIKSPFFWQLLWPLLAILTAGGIFYSSSRDGTVSGGASMGIVERFMSVLPFIPLDASQLNFILRKGAHFFVFFVLAFCVAHGLKYHVQGWRWLTLSWVITALYGVADEIHQYFVPGRSCEITDMLINASGAAVGVGLVWLWQLYKPPHIVEGSIPSADIHNANGAKPQK